MKDLAGLDALHSRLDDVLATARKGMSNAEADRIRVDQALNDRAYFFLCWGRLERAVDEACREAIRRRCSHPDWLIRRGWDVYDSDDPRPSGLPFEVRAAKALDRSAGRGRPHAIAMRHHEARNRIAHGELDQARIDLASVIPDFYLIQSALHRAT